MGPITDLLPKHEGMCYSGHSDTLAWGHSDWFPAASYYRETTQPIRASLKTWVNPQQVWTKKEEYDRKEL